MAEAVILAVGLNASASALKIIGDSTSSWGGLLPRRVQIARFKSLVERNTVLGFSRNMERKKYAITTVIQAMGHCDKHGAVSVAFVPPALGKTTAAKFFLHHNKDQVQGIAFCRERKGIPYVTEMLRLLGMNTQNPPDGWLTCLIDAMNEASAMEVNAATREAFLILDEFVNETTDRIDSALLETIKSLIRNTRLRVIVLTPSEPYANFLLTLNKLQGIVPLSGTYDLQNYPSGQWQSMQWTITMMKTAAKHDPRFSEQQEDRIINAIDDYIQTNEIENLTYLDIASVLQNNFLQSNRLSQYEVDLTASVSADGVDAGFCAACQIM